MFIVIDTVTEQQYEPSYSFSDTGRYVPVNRIHMRELGSMNDLVEFLAREKSIVSRRIFRAEEVVAKTSTVLENVRK